MAKNYKMYLGGKWVDRKQKLRVESPYDDSLVATVAAASTDDYTEAIKVAHEKFQETKELPSYHREATCLAIAAGMEKNIDKFAKAMASELGKAYSHCKLEVGRSIGVFRTAAEEAKRIGGEMIDLDWNPGAEERIGLVRRFPMGVIAGISPFYFNLKLVAQKVCPANG